MILSFASVQMIIAALITKKNKHIFEKYTANKFHYAVKELYAGKKTSALLLTAMYGLLPFEQMIIFFYYRVK